MHSLRRLLERLARTQDGLAMIEFAFAAPLFVSAIVMGLELTNLALVHHRVSQMAMTIADNAGRVPTGIDEAHIYEVFSGAQVIGRAMNFEANGRIVLSSIEDNGRSGAKKGQWIPWQRCWGSGPFAPAYGRERDGEKDGAFPNGLGRLGRQIKAAPNTAVMFVEASYTYQPLIGAGFFNPPVIRYESAFNVRGRVNNALTNTQSLNKLTC